LAFIVELAYFLASVHKIADNRQILRRMPNRIKIIGMNKKGQKKAAIRK